MRRILCLLVAVIALVYSFAAAAMAESSAQKYEKAMELLKENKYTEAGIAFSALGTYADSPRYTMYCNAIAAGEAGFYSIAVENLNSLSGFLDSNLQAVYYTGLSWEAAEDYEHASEVLSSITLYRDVATRMAGYPDLINARDYRKADAFEKAGKLEEALSGFRALDSYADSAERAAAMQKKIKERDAAAEEQARADAYAAADRAEQNGDYAAAYSGFSQLGDYKDSAARAAAIQDKGKYALAMQYAMEGNYSSAYSLFDSLGDYEDSAVKAYILSVTTFATVEDRGNGIAAFQLNDAWGVLNVNTNSITSPVWRSIDQFNSLGLAMVSQNYKYGYINTQGEVIISCEWDEVSAFSDFLCIVRLNSSFGLVNSQGSIVSNTQWKRIGDSYIMDAPSFSDEKIKVQDSKGKWGFIDKNGQIVIQPQYTAVRSFHEGLVAVQDGDKWKYIDSKNEVVIPALYSQALDFSDGKAEVFLPGTGWQIIDKTGTLNFFIDPKIIMDYNYAIKLEEAGELEQALTLFSSINYMDSMERACKLSYTLGIIKQEAQDWEGAVKAFEQAGGYSDAARQIKETRYQQATALNKAGKYEESYAIYASIAGYKDVDSIVKTDDNIAVVAAREAGLAPYKTVGSYVTFGKYPQLSGVMISTAIEWLVLDYDAENNRALLISRHGLDTQPYNTKPISITWEKCTLRTWLNEEFFNKAFSATEQSAILLTNVDNSSSQGYSEYSKSGGNNTQDRIFLLSCAEASQYFGEMNKNNINIRVAPTAYAIKQGAFTSSSYKTANGAAAGWWWLRSPGNNQKYAARVLSEGSLHNSSVRTTSGVVRPAFWLNLNADIF